MKPLAGVPEGRRRVHGPRKPWPRLPVPGQEGKGPTVTDIPLPMELHFQRHIGLRLIRGMAKGLIGPLVWSRRNPHPAALDDAKILALMFGTIFSRFVSFTLDPQDEAGFAPYLADRRPDETDFKIDFSAMARLHALPGIYVAPTVTLGRIAADGTQRLVAMRINGLVLTPADGNAWELARYFLMQGAGMHGVLVSHTALHFQYDAINALATSLLPPTHVLHRLLAPHFEFTLSLNRAALHSRLSILTNKPYLAYATFPGDAASIHHFQSAGWSGIEGNSAYPAYRFCRRPPPLHGDLGAFLAAYYEVFLAFAARALAAVTAEDRLVLDWAEEVSGWLPGFPGAEEIQAPGVLAEVAASIMWGTSLVHSTEHYGLVEEVPLAAIPLRLRVMPPFSRTAAPLERRRLTRPGDMFRQRVAWEMLVRDHAATRLMDVDYRFDEPSLQQANAEFRAALKSLDANLPVRRYIPLERVACGIQF
jgi:hypothetical protein